MTCAAFTTRTSSIATASTKSPLLPGETASFLNYTSYSKGIDGIMVDFNSLPGTPTAADFSFSVGDSATPASWAPAPAPLQITVRAVDGIQRVTIIWTDNAIENEWLQVTVKATPDTGLANPVTFYYGNLIGAVALRPPARPSARPTSWRSRTTRPPPPR